MVLYSWGVGSCCLVSLCPPSPLPPPPLPTPLLPLLPLPLASWLGWYCCLHSAGACPLGGICPGSRLNIWATIACASSSVVHPPPMRAVRLLLVQFLAAVPLFPPHYRLVLWWGASVDLECSHPSPPVGIARGARVTARGVTPLPPLGQGVSLLPFPASLARGVHAAAPGVPPSSSSSWLHAWGERCLVGVSPYLPWPRTGSTCCWVGGGAAACTPRARPAGEGRRETP